MNREVCNNMKVFELIQDNKIEEFESFIKTNPEVLDQGPTWTLIRHIIGSSENEVNFIRILTANGVVPTDFDIFYAVYFDCIEVVKLFIAMGYPIDNACGQKDKNGNMYDENWRPLFRAVNVGELEMVKLLVEAGADINHKMTGGWIDGWSAIEMSQYRESKPKVREYLEQVVSERKN